MPDALWTPPPLPSSLYDEARMLPRFSLYHDAPWHRVLTAAFGWGVGAVTARDAAGRLALFLPAVDKRRLGRRIRVALPLTHRLAPLLAPDLEAAALNWEDCLSAVPLEVHGALAHPRFRPIRPHVVTTLDLTPCRDPDAMWRRALRARTRSKVSRARRAGYVARSSADPKAFDTFAGLQNRTRRRQRAPTYPRAFFPALWQELGTRGLARVHLVEDSAGRTVAGVMFLDDGETTIYGYGASLPDPAVGRAGGPHLAMWAALCHALDHGRTRVDFGSSPRHQHGLVFYKEGFGGVTEPLDHAVAAPSGDPGALVVDQAGPLARLGGAVLHHLPQPVFDRLSPALLRLVL